MQHFLFVSHIVVLGLGLLLSCAAAVAALLYFIEHRELKHKRLGKVFAWIPSLEVLDHWTVRALVGGFSFLTLGMVTGLYLAHKEWHGDWLKNPKFAFSFGVWLWYVVLLGVRHRLGIRGGRFFALIFIGFLLLLLTFSGVWMFSVGKEA